MVWLTVAGCGDDDAAPGRKDAATGQAPEVSAVRLTETRLPVLRAGEVYAIGLEFDYAGGAADAAQAIVSLTRAGRSYEWAAALPDPRSGTGHSELTVHSEFDAGRYELAVEVIDVLYAAGGAQRALASPRRSGRRAAPVPARLRVPLRRPG